MTWSTSPDVHAFLDAAGEFLSAQPIEHTVLLTEAAYLAARPSAAPDQLYGWWTSAAGVVAGAFLQAPRHPPVLSTMPIEAVESLAEFRPGLPPFGVDGRMVSPVVAAWRDQTGVELVERSRIRLYRLGQLDAPKPPAGHARTATEGDRQLLVSWYETLMAAHPDDPSDLDYVVDDPISYGGITLWEVDGMPTAMAGRSRTIAEMVRLSAVYSPLDDGQANAAFAAACEAAQTVARDVLVFTSADDSLTDTTYRMLGFRPVLDRVMIEPQSDVGD